LFPFADLESDIVLRDGTTLHVRPSRADDSALALRFLQGLSAESLYYRFMMAPSLDLAYARKCVAVDQNTDVVLVADRAGEIVGIAGYYPDPDEPWTCTRCGFPHVCRKDYVGDE
jgi:hypothetical protein